MSFIDKHTRTKQRVDTGGQSTPTKSTPNTATPSHYHGGSPTSAPSSFTDSNTKTAVYFSHPSSSVGQLTIENGMDDIRWGYHLNTATYPTYGGEVVQILSVYIEDLTIRGTVATRSQLEAIYSYFAAYMQIATQGRTPRPNAGVSAYNLQPVTMHYPHRDWTFLLYPKSTPGFRIATEVTASTWQLGAHVIDDSVNLDPIKAAIKEQAVAQGMNLSKINGEISPTSGDPTTNPFQTFTQGTTQGQTALQNDAGFYANLIQQYYNGDYSSWTGGLGSGPLGPIGGSGASGTSGTASTGGTQTTPGSASGNQTNNSTATGTNTTTGTGTGGAAIK